MDDSRIIELFYERSEQAIVELSQKYGDTCFKIAVNILKSKSDAEECVNDAYLGAWNTIPPQNPNPLLAYICRIVRNISIKRYHHNTAKKRNSYYDVALDELENCLSSGENAQDELDAKELTALLDTFLARLDKINRNMFIRRYWFSDSISDIATTFKMNSRAVTIRLSRTRKKLKHYLSKKGVAL